MISATIKHSSELTAEERLFESSCGSNATSTWLLIHGCGSLAAKYPWNDGGFSACAGCDCVCGGELNWEYHQSRSAAGGRITHTGSQFDQAASDTARDAWQHAAEEYARTQVPANEEVEDTKGEASKSSSSSGR